MATENTYMDNADLYRVANPKLSDSDIKSFNIEKAAYFKSTIAVCTIYGIFAAVMLFIIVVSPQGSAFLTESFRAFSLTFVGGIIFVIVLLVLQITSFKPTIRTADPYDKDMCPDYWKLVKNENPFPGNDGFLTQYKCVPTSSVYSPTSNVVRLPSAPTAQGSPNSHTYFNANSNLVVNGNLVCSNVYPNYLASLSVNDRTNNPNKIPNLYTCAFAETCGIPWTSMCPV